MCVSTLYIFSTASLILRVVNFTYALTSNDDNPPFGHVECLRYRSIHATTGLYYAKGPR